MRLSKKLFFLLILLLPLNLGKHFEVSASYVWGILSDYLVPIIFVQDLLIVGILVIWLVECGAPSRLKLLNTLNTRFTQIVFLLLFSIGFSVLGSDRLIPSLNIFLRTVLYAGLFFYSVFEVDLKKDFLTIIKLLSVSIIFLSILALGQFLKQASVFNNYLAFGEQPYFYQTWGITKELVLGKTVVPPYGLFRHPNIFAGFLSLALLWLFSYINKNRLVKVAFFSGLFTLLLTFSVVAWAGFTLGLLSFLYIRNIGSSPIELKKKRVVFVFVLMVILINVLTPLLSKFDDPSLFRRGNLYEHSLKMVLINPLFGVGPGNFIVGLGDLTFIQPVHNIFLLILAENGVFSLLFFISLIILAIKKSINPSYFFILLISILQIIFISTLDHYFWTIHQTLLLMWLIFGLVFSKNP